MKNKIIGISICMLLTAAAVPAVTSLQHHPVPSMIPHTPVTSRAENWTEIQKLLAADGEGGDFFGYSVSIAGDTALVGAFHDSDNGPYSGSAYVFTRTGTTWTQQAKLLASDGQAGDWFGVSVSLFGNTALIGAHGDDDNGDSSGSAYVFILNGTTWTQQAKLLASNGAAGDVFGWGVSLYGDTALIGAQFDDDNGDESGSAYVFTRTGTTWTQQAQLNASDAAPGDLFGCSVSLSGDTALIGAYWDDDNGEDSGSAYVFTRTGTTWTQQTKLFASDGVGMDLFGWSVALSESNALIGANFNVGTGSAYVFVKENEPPVADFIWTPQNPSVYQQITFNASASHDTDGTIISYEWDWNNDGIYDEAHSAPTTMHTWTSAGNYPVTLRVTDEGAAASTITKMVNVSAITITIDITGGLGVSAVMTNSGTANLTNITWQLHVKGGMFGLINATAFGLINLQAGESKTRGTSILLGFGAITITVQVADQEKTTTGTQIIIFSIVKK